MITNGKIIGENFDNIHYRAQFVARGHREYVMTRSSLCDFAECPIKWLRGVEEKPTPATDWGSLLDCMVLDEANFNKRYVIIPKTYPAGEKHAKVKAGLMNAGDPLPWNANATYCDDWIAAHTQGREAVKTDELEACRTAVARLREDEDIADILDSSRKQVMVTAEWHDPDTELVIPLKILVDIVPDDDCDLAEASESLIDLKSTKSAKPDRWVRDVVTYGLHTQAALYRDVWNSVPGIKPRKFFKHILSENEEPYHVEKQNLTAEFLDLGKMVYESALKLYCQCLSSKTWPGYRNRMVVNGWGQTEPTAWQISSQEV